MAPLHRNRLSTRAMLGAFAVALALVLSTPPHIGVTASKSSSSAGTRAAALVQWGAEGRFSAPVNWPADSPVMVHASLLPDGRVLFWGRDKVRDPFTGLLTKEDVVGKSTARIWDPVTGGFENVDITSQNGATNLFCSGHSFLPDGRLFVAGGHKHKHPLSKSGDEHTNIFNPVTKTWSAGPIMDKGRWYPFTVTMDTGEVAIVAGTYETGPDPTDPTKAPLTTKQQRPEIYNPTTNTLELLNVPNTFGEELQNYPYLFLDPMAGGNRGVFIAGPKYSIFWNPRGGADGKGSWSTRTQHPYNHIDGSAVMYDSEQGKILLTGGRLSPAGNTNNLAKTITLDHADPQWQSAQSMHFPRTFHTSTILPDGKVLVTGGVPCRGGHTIKPCYADGGNGEVPLGETKQAEMWDPTTGAWSLMATGTETRTYHSTALLLPDATVLVGGGGLPDGWSVPPDPADDANGTERHIRGKRNVEVYYPPYLYDSAGNLASRPAINSAPTEVSYGQQFTLNYGNASEISRVAWIRLPSVTHGFNTDQRINVLNFSATGTPGQLTITAPVDPRKCPPGYYMLFIMRQGENNKMVPSVAKIVKIRQNREEFIARRAVRHNNRIHVFYRHLNDTALRYVSQSTVDSKTFSVPVNLGGGLNSNPIAIKNQDGRLQVFVLGLDNAIYTNQETTPGSGTWSGFTGIVTGPNLQVIAGARNLDGRIQIFYRGSDNALWYVVQNAANSPTWTTVSLGGGITSEPAVGMNADGRLEVFVRGLDNALYHNWQTMPGGAWSGFSRLGGQMTSGPFVAHQSDGRLDVFLRGTDNGVWHIRQMSPNSSNSWSSFEGLGGTLAGDHPYNSPSAALGPDGRLQVFGRWADNSLRTLVQNAPNGSFPWNAWNNLGGWIDATVPPPARSNDGRFFIFVRGGGGALYFNTHTAPNSYNLWDGFAHLGDAGHSF